MAMACSRCPSTTSRSAAPQSLALSARGASAVRLVPAAAATALLAAAVSCSALEPREGCRPLTAFVDVSDVSGSGDVAARCAELSARLRPLLEDRRTRRLDVLALATGEGGAGEPRVLVPWTTYVPAAGLYETPGAAVKQRAEWIAAVERVCDANLRGTGASPVYEAVERGLQAIDARCEEAARERFGCARKLLAVQSDLRSTHGAMGAYLRGLARKPKKAPTPPRRLAADGVELSFCGLSNTDAGDGLPTEAVLAGWSEVLGQRIVVDPTCAAAPSIQGTSP